MIGGTLVNITEEINLIEKLFASEINYFYNNYSDFDESKKIIISIAAESIYDLIMSMRIPQVQKDIIGSQGKLVTDSLNGSVVLGNDIEEDGVHAIFSLKALEYEDGGLTFCGTVNHEYTHANDFIDFARFLGVSNANLILRNDKWFSVQMWSEYHARRNGYYRVLDLNTGGEWVFPENYDKELLLLTKKLWVNNRMENELYELMQVCGRYSILEDLFPKTINDFDRDILENVCDGEKRYACNCIYDFCVNHKNFNTFIKDIDLFSCLLN